jgi:nitroimidazol reductase NimA-like FMN-containing flavoprotein (pyridoxamine 5'-phosphate oxidase superfamily)
MTTDDTAGVNQLSVSECWTLLRSVEFGRLAVLAGDQPDIFPVNFVVDHGTLVFRTAEGTKLSAAVGANAIAFEADGQDSVARQAWSVVIKGTAEPVPASELMDLVTLPLWPLQGDPKPRFVRIVPAQISGRSFSTVDSQRWLTPLSEARPTATE